MNIRNLTVRLFLFPSVSCSVPQYSKIEEFAFRTPPRRFSTNGKLSSSAQKRRQGQAQLSSHTTRSKEDKPVDDVPNGAAAISTANVSVATSVDVTMTET